MQQESNDEEQDNAATGGGAGSNRGHGAGLLYCTFGSSAQYTGPDSTGGHFVALQFALTAAYPPHHMLSSIFPNSPPSSTAWIEDSASSVHGTGSGKFVYNKRCPLPTEAFLLVGEGRKFKVECFGSFDVILLCKDDVRVTLVNVTVVPGLALDLMSFTCIQEKNDILMNHDGNWILNSGVHFVKLPAGNCIQATRESSNDWGGAGMSQNCPRFGRGRHENSPFRGLI